MTVNGVGIGTCAEEQGYYVRVTVLRGYVKRGVAVLVGGSRIKPGFEVGFDGRPVSTRSVIPQGTSPIFIDARTGLSPWPLGHTRHFLLNRSSPRIADGLMTAMGRLRPVRVESGHFTVPGSFGTTSVMTQHQVTPILPCNDIDATQVFYERLGFTVTAGDDGFRIMTDGKGWQIALRPAEHGWVIPDRNSHGIYLYCDDVDAIADKVRDIIVEKGAPHRKPWGLYEFAVGDPDGVLVRIGRPARPGDPLHQ